MDETERKIGKEQMSILSGQLKSMIDNSSWGNAEKEAIVDTATQIKNLIRQPEKQIDDEDITHFLDVLVKAKVKAVLINDKEYYGLCQKLDSIISNVRKHNMR